MKLIKIEIREEIKEERQSGNWKKFNTNIENLFIYLVQNGGGYPYSILNEQKNKYSDIYGQKSIIISYSDYINGNLTGQIVSVLHSRGTKKYDIGLKKYESNVPYKKDYYTTNIF